MKLKILTFNWHEPYLCLLSKLGHEFLVVEPEIRPGNIRKWNLGMRPVPNNFELISMAQVIQMKTMINVALMVHGVQMAINGSAMDLYYPMMIMMVLLNALITVRRDI